MFIKRSIVYFIGFNVMVFGIALLITSGLGQSAWDGVNVGINNVFGLSVGNATILVALILLSISYGLTKNLKVYYSLITSLIQGVLVDYYLHAIHEFIPTRDLFTDYAIFIVGIIMMAMGCSIYIQSNFPTNHVDCLMVAISKTFKKDLRTSKWITDAIAIVATLVMTGSIKLGTFPIMLTLGPLIHSITKVIVTPINRVINSPKK